MKWSNSSRKKIIFTTLIALLLVESLIIIDELSPFTLPMFLNASPIQIEFLGENNTWSFRYPGTDDKLYTSDDLLVTENTDLFFPANRRVEIIMKSKDLIYCLDIPELEKSQLAIPGRNFTLQFNARSSETLSLEPGSVCGITDDDIARKIIMLSEQDFDSWMTK